MIKTTVDNVCLIADLKYEGKDSQWTRSGVFSINPSCWQHFLKYKVHFKFLLVITYSLLTQYCAGGKIKKNDMGWACGAYRGGERCAQGVGGEA
jgi:hypothetical protein